VLTQPLSEGKGVNLGVRCGVFCGRDGRGAKQPSLTTYYFLTNYTLRLGRNLAVRLESPEQPGCRPLHVVVRYWLLVVRGMRWERIPVGFKFLISNSRFQILNFEFEFWIVILQGIGSWGHEPRQGFVGTRTKAGVILWVLVRGDTNQGREGQEPRQGEPRRGCCLVVK